MPYLEGTNGSFIVEKANGIEFNYSGSDPEFGAMQAKELHNHLADVLSRMDCEVDLAHGPCKLQARRMRMESPCWAATGPR